MEHTPAGGTVADLMCGTGSVSEALKMKGFRVIAADVLTFAVLHAQVRLLLNRAPTFQGLDSMPYHCVLEQLNLLPVRNEFFTREFSPAGPTHQGVAPRKYFTEANASKIDAIRLQIKQWSDCGLITSAEKGLLLHDLVLAANKVANIAGTYGHFRSTWSSTALRPIEMVPTIFISGHRTDHSVLQGPAEHLAQSLKADLCYLDPPYMKRQYAANYHILETLARLDEPAANGVSGLRPWRDQHSAFCTKTNIRAAFGRIFSTMQCNRFLISYSEDGLLSLGQLKSLFEEYGEVSYKCFSYPRFRSNDSLLSGTVTEYLFQVVKS
jgi:adenine-specific DNA-methyltransferase